MTLQACADIVRRGDPDRFTAAMAAPVAARRVLFPLYAFNVEVARAPWVTEEPMIAEMRLQWWRDALEEIRGGNAVRAHEVTTPLADVLDAEGAELLDQLVQARRWDIYKDAFEDDAHFSEYLEMTGTALMWTAARLLGAADSASSVVSALGRGAALARFLQAVPDLEARSRIPLVDGRPESVAALARRALDVLPTSRVAAYHVIPAARPALIEAWQTEPLLKQIIHEPARVAQGRVGLSEFRKRLRLLRWA